MIINLILAILGLWARATRASGDFTLHVSPEVAAELHKPPTELYSLSHGAGPDWNLATQSGHLAGVPPSENIPQKPQQYHGDGHPEEALGFEYPRPSLKGDAPSQLGAGDDIMRVPGDSLLPVYRNPNVHRPRPESFNKITPAELDKYKNIIADVDPDKVPSFPEAMGYPTMPPLEREIEESQKLADSKKLPSDELFPWDLNKTRINPADPVAVQDHIVEASSPHYPHHASNNRGSSHYKIEHDVLIDENAEDWGCDYYGMPFNKETCIPFDSVQNPSFNYLFFAWFVEQSPLPSMKEQAVFDLVVQPDHAFQGDHSLFQDQPWSVRWQPSSENRHGGASVSFYQNVAVCPRTRYTASVYFTYLKGVVEHGDCSISIKIGNIEAYSDWREADHDQYTKFETDVYTTGINEKRTPVKVGLSCNSIPGYDYMNRNITGFLDSIHLQVLSGET